MNYQLIIAQVGFVILTLVFFGFLLKEFYVGIDRTAWDSVRKQRSKRMLLYSLLGWTLLLSVFSISGIMSDFSLFPLNFLPVILVPLIAIIVFMRSDFATQMLAGIPQHRLIRLQVFRVFVEILLWLLFIGNLLPEQMSFEGRNFDILAGLTAPFIAWLYARNRMSRVALIAWNVACLGLLINIVTIAILSTPSPVRVFMNDPANTIVTLFPISWLPGLLVPLAYGLHFCSLKQVLARNEKVASHRVG